MTARLIGLISIVLLVTLGALALLMAHFQRQVRGEVAKTVSKVGQATIRTLEAGPRLMEWHVGGEEVALAGAQDTDEAGETSRERHEAIVFAFGDAEARSGAERGGGPSHAADADPAIGGGAADGPSRSLERDVVFLPDGRRVELQDLSPTQDAPLRLIHRQLGDGAEGEFGDGTRIVIHVDEVRAVESGEHRLFLRIPASGLSEAASKDSGMAVETETEDDAAVSVTTELEVDLAHGRRRAMREVRRVVGGEASARRDFLVSVSTADLDGLFASMGLRSSLAFLGVLAFGCALAAGVAARFTRPIRRLDSAIHRLSEGHLDTEVEVRGHDEISRLSGAFNEMARSLQAHERRARELTRREKLSALGQLAAGVAHDVRNPLHSVVLTLQQLRETARPEDADRRAAFDEGLGVLREEIDRLDALVANFLRFTRAEKSPRLPTDLGALVRETARLVEKEADRRRVRIATEIAEDIGQPELDAEALRSALLNLVLNAFEAMPEGGSLRIAVACEGEDVAIEVEDDGRGISEQDRERVFDFAYTTKDGGHGLGLAMVHQIVVEEHGGRIDLASEPGKGTRIRLRLPLEESGE